MIDRKGRRIRQGTVQEDAICVTDGCPLRGEEPMTVRAAYRHHEDTGHTIVIQRIKMKEVSRP